MRRSRKKFMAHNVSYESHMRILINDQSEFIPNPI